MTRLHFLLPHIGIVAKIVDALLLARVEARPIHVVARRGTPLADLPAANFVQMTDFLPALAQGLAVGGATGLMVAAWSTNFAVGGGIVLASSLIGALLGAWSSSMIGASTPNRRLTRYAEAIAEGEVLVMADVPRARAELIERLIAAQHPEADAGIPNRSPSPLPERVPDRSSVRLPRAVRSGSGSTASRRRILTLTRYGRPVLSVYTKFISAAGIGRANR